METWMPVVGYESHYAISSEGRVKRVAPGRAARVGKILKPGKNVPGYLYVRLSRGNVQRNKEVHRMVAEAFVGHPPTDRHEVNHRDGNKTNNVAENLEWVTRSQNVRHALANGLIKRRRRSAR